MIYDLFLVLFVLGMAPKIIWQKARGKRFCTLGDRFGRNPPVGPWAKKIWIHAVSVGEIRAAEPLIRQLRQSDPGVSILVTTTTMTGFEEAGRSLQADLLRFLPLDFSWVMRRWIRSFAPSLLIFIEGDVWPNLVRQAKCAGVKTALASGKISEKSARRLRRFPFLAKRLYRPLDALCVQNEEYRSRFAALVERPIAITGNLKLDVEIKPLDPSGVRDRFNLPTDLVVTLSCTHAPEEKELLYEMLTLWKRLPKVVLFLAPRHPERFEAAAAILDELGISFCRWKEKREGERVILVDAMGQLPYCYVLSRIAVVAGSFSSKIGGHNVLEPLFYGCPVLFGPHMEKQKEFARIAIESKSGWQVRQDELSQALFEKISLERPLVADISKRGAAKSTLEVIKQIW